MKTIQKTGEKAKRHSQKSGKGKSLKARFRRAAVLEQQIIASVPHDGISVDQSKKK